MRTFACLTLTLIILFSLGLVENTFVGIVQSATEINSTIITSDTTWTKANGPYELKGPIAINKDVTLTIESGVQVFFNGHNMQVNGTLVARGNNNEPISFLTGEGHPSEIIFMPSSTSWDEQTGTGSIIEKVNIPSNSFKITISGGSPKIASSISQAMITINNGSPKIDMNQFSGHITSITIINGAPIISNNRLSSFKIIIENGSPIIIGNVITGFPIMYEGSLAGYTGTCIEAFGGNSYVTNNSISNCGLAMQVGEGIIQNNTISASTKGILVAGSVSPTIVYNNILVSSQSIVLSEGANQDVNAADNWWDSTDTAEIDSRIWDFNDDFNLGKVNYTPILTSPNPDAPSVPDTPFTPTSTPTSGAFPTVYQSPTATSLSSGAQGSLDWVVVVTLVLLGFIGTMLVVVAVLLRKRNRKVVLH